MLRPGQEMSAQFEDGLEMLRFPGDASHAANQGLLSQGSGDAGESIKDNRPPRDIPQLRVARMLQRVRKAGESLRSISRVERIERHLKEGVMGLGQGGLRRWVFTRLYPEPAPRDSGRRVLR